MPQPPIAGFSAFEIKQALMRGAAGDHGAESGLVLLMAGGWLPELSQADLITVEICLEGCCGDGPVAKLDWAGVHAALQDGRLAGSAGEIAVLRVAASLAHGLLVDLGELREAGSAEPSRPQSPSLHMTPRSVAGSSVTPRTRERRSRRDQ